MCSAMAQHIENTNIRKLYQFFVNFIKQESTVSVSHAGQLVCLSDHCSHSAINYQTGHPTRFQQTFQNSLKQQLHSSHNNMSESDSDNGYESAEEKLWLWASSNWTAWKHILKKLTTCYWDILWYMCPFMNMFLI